MADLNEIIANSLQGAEGDRETDEVETPAEQADPEPPPEPAVTEPPAGKEPEKPAEPDEIDKLLTESGVKRGKGTRENLIPYTRLKKILTNQRTKLTDAHTGELTKAQGELQAARQQLETFNRTDQLIRENPDRYMELLGVLHPQYKKFLQNPGAAPVEKPKPEFKDDLSDMPQPSSADGYTAEDLKKLMSWSEARAEAKLLPKFQSELDRRFKPLDDAKSAYETRQQMAPKVQKQISAARERWGALLDTHQEEILKKMGQDQESSFEAIVESVLIPHLKADRDKMRSELLDEIKARPKAASPNGGSASAATEPNRARTTEEIIKEQLDALPR